MSGASGPVPDASDSGKPGEAAVDPAELAVLRQRIAQAARICAFTGAGISAESGIPTFRDAMGGLWARFEPAQLASAEGFQADPARVWAWYAERRAGVRAAQPNAGHRALGAFAQRHPGRLRVLTQNVDGLHQRAGNADAVCLHGDLMTDQWLRPCPRAASNPGRAGQGACNPAQATPGQPPSCARCGNLLRPGVVWFGEMLPAPALQTAQAEAQACTLMLVVGTSGAVWPAAGLAGLARRSGAYVAVLNPAPTELDGTAHCRLRGPAATLLPALLDGL